MNTWAGRERAVRLCNRLNQSLRKIQTVCGNKTELQWTFAFNSMSRELQPKLRRLSIEVGLMSPNLLQKSRRPQSEFKARAVCHESSPKGCNSISTKFHGIVDIPFSTLKNFQIRNYSWLDALKDTPLNQFRPI